MKRKLLAQIANEWRGNFWLALELLIVSVVLWFLADIMYTRLSIYNEPLGFEYEHCYNVKFSTLSDKVPGYKEYESSDQVAEEKMTLVKRLESRPEIEAVGLGNNATMYNFSNSNAVLEVDSFSTRSWFVVQRIVTPGFVKVFRYRGANGESPEEIARIMEENPDGFFASRGILCGDGVMDVSPYVGHTFENNGNGYSNVVLKGVLQTVKYSDFHNLNGSQSTLHPMYNEMVRYANEIVVRVKDNMDVDFENKLMKDALTSLRVGNLYVTGVQSISDQREIFNRDDMRNLRNNIVGAAFLAFNVFLGLLGTFWFRTQQREHEIAIRRVCGASSKSIFKRTISEGLIILTLVTPLALLIDYFITANQLNTYYDNGFFVPLRFFGCAAVAYALMVLMIVAGAFFPARRAVKIEPAVALAEN